MPKSATNRPETRRGNASTRRAAASDDVLAGAIASMGAALQVIAENQRQTNAILQSILAPTAADAPQRTPEPVADKSPTGPEGPAKKFPPLGLGLWEREKHHKSQRP